MLISELSLQHWQLIDMIEVKGQLLHGYPAHMLLLVVLKLDSKNIQIGTTTTCRSVCLCVVVLLLWYCCCYGDVIHMSLVTGTLSKLIMTSET